MRACYVLRVFTSGDEGGNHLGVIADATGLDDAGMQAVAAELAFSETVYLDWNERETPYVRIFTPSVELPFAGHPLVGTAWVLATMAPGGLDRMECGIGEVAFRLDADGRTAWVDVPATATVEPAPDAADLAARARVPAPVRAWWVDVGKRDLVLETDDPASVAAASPDLAAIRDIADGLYLIAPIAMEKGVKARYFAPRIGVDEDPATGSTAVELAQALASEGQESGELTIHQGAEVGFPSRIQVQWSPAGVRLGGTVIRDEVRVLED